MKSLLQAILIGLSSLLIILAFYLLSAPALYKWNVVRRIAANHAGYSDPHLESLHHSITAYNRPLWWIEHHYEWTRKPFFRYRRWLSDACYHLFYTPSPSPIAPAPSPLHPDPFIPEPLILGSPPPSPNNSSDLLVRDHLPAPAADDDPSTSGVIEANDGF